MSLSFGYLVIQLGRNAIPPLLPAVTDDLGISPFLAGAALTTMTGAYAVAMYPGGRLSDGLTRKTVIAAALVVTGVGTLSILVAQSFFAFAVGVATFGLGAGLYWIALRALLADLFVARRGQAFGLQDALGFVGPVAAASAAVVALEVATWRAVFLGIIVPLLAQLVVAHRWIGGRYEVSTVSLDLRETSDRVFGNRHVLSLVVSYSCVVFAIQAVIGFLPTFLQASKGLSPTLASGGFALLFVSATVSMPVAGYAGDRFRHTPVAVGGLVTSLLGLGALVVSETPVPIGLGIFLIGTGTWAFPPVVQAHLMSLFPDDSIGGDLGAFKTVYAAIGSLGPTYIGIAASIDSYASGFLGLAVPLVLGILILLRTS